MAMLQNYVKEAFLYNFSDVRYVGLPFCVFAGYSCKLLTPATGLLIINEHSLDVSTMSTVWMQVQ